MNAIKIQNLTKYYQKGKIKAVDGISFSVPNGSKFGFLGPNGAGKTTTIRCIMGLLNYHKGDIYISGKRVHPLKNVFYRNNIGYLPGDLGLYANITANHLFKYFSTLFDIHIDQNYISELAERLKLNLNQDMRVLSKGNKQKVGIISALMGKPEILIMDEPTSGLDPLMQREFYIIIKELQEISNCTVFFSSHILSEVEKFCERVAIINKGKLIEVADIRDLKAKSIKKFELDFETSAARERFFEYLKSEFPENQYTITYNNGNQIIFSISKQNSRRILKKITDHQEHKFQINDFLIENSSLEHIFIQYYEGGEIR
ncbi:MAG: ABC-2 type transport system ATP-binding protein [Promethearchaeota archaeon]|nr:MAG: ABC-2 type transport system ATP-binding protein [Candidatus Lokiarchaeota archaeon]